MASQDGWANLIINLAYLQKKQDIKMQLALTGKLMITMNLIERAQK